MIRADNHSDLWIHERQVDCITALQSDLRDARAALDSTIIISVNGTLYRALPEPVGYSGTAETVGRVESGALVVGPASLHSPEEPTP
jgi:hypothetical protein